MNIDLTGKRAFVCGASKGIGKATAHELAALGASVTVLARDAALLQNVCDGLNRDAGQDHHSVVADFSNPDALEKIVTDHISAHGPFHILINNSGGPAAGPVHTATRGDFLKVFTQHLLGNHTMMQAVLPGMKAAGYGRVINIISTSVKQPIKNLGISNTIRGAVANWAKTLAGEVAEFGVTVNNILPGATETDRLEEIIAGKASKMGLSIEEVIAEEQGGIPAGRFGTPQELAQAIAFLASPAAGYINGINLPVDGGRTGCL